MTTDEIINQCKPCHLCGRRCMEVEPDTFGGPQSRIVRTCIVDDEGDKDAHRTEWGTPAEIIAEWNAYSETLFYREHGNG